MTNGTTTRAYAVLGRGAADNPNMQPVLEAAVPVSRLYVKGNALVRLDVVEGRRVLHLLVTGTTGQCESYRFEEREALLIHHVWCEADLQAQGYTRVASMRDHPREDGGRGRYPHVGTR